LAPVVMARISGMMDFNARSFPASSCWRAAEVLGFQRINTV
jgi:hypothetical protein